LKSWTDGKPQITIWTDAWLKRLAVITQGHDWHLLVVSKNDQKMTIWEQIGVGSTRSCFDAMKVVTVFHWLRD
jgi:hypothetical protein